MDTDAATMRRTIGSEASVTESPGHGTTPRGQDDAVHLAGPAEAMPAEDMLGELAHAVSNSLNTIVTASQLAGLLMGDGRQERARVSLDCVERECLRVARLLQDGRALAGFRIAEARADVDLTELLEGCARALADRGVVRVDGAGGVGSVRGDPEALRRLFVELLDNAFEFGAGRVDVTLASDAPGSSIRVDVQDDGPGLAAAPARMFAPFFSTRPEEHSGLGLALARRIAAGHGGSIAVEPSEHGARLRVTLPVGAGQEAPAPRAAGKPA